MPPSHYAGYLVGRDEVYFLLIHGFNSTRCLSFFTEKKGKVKEASDLCSHLRKVFADLGSTDQR